MRRRRFAVVSVLALLLVLSAVRSGGEIGPVTVTLNGWEAPVELVESEDVWLTVDPDSVTATGLTAVIHKRNIPTVWYGNLYYIAQKTRRDRKNWTEMPWLNGNAPDWWGTLIGMGFYPDGVPKEERWDGEWDMESNMQINWTDVYGSLEPGEYLLVKEVVDLDDCSAGRHIGARFTVEKE